MLSQSFARAATARLVFAALAVFGLSASSDAAGYLTFVASNGNDANPCTLVTAPCKTLQRAYNVTSANGTIRVLTGLQTASSLSIAKNITISGDGAELVGGGFSVNSGSVTLRGLALNGVKGFHLGISIGAAAVRIENCTIEGYIDDGIHVSPSATATKLFISDTIVQGNNVGLDAANAKAKVEVESSRFVGNTAYGIVSNAARMSVIRSVVSGNYYGIRVDGGSSANITETSVANNNLYGVWVRGGFAILSSSVMSGNSVGFIVSAGQTAEVTDSVFANNTTGVQNFGTLYTRRNNTLNWNGTDYKGSGAKISAPAF